MYKNLIYLSSIVQKRKRLLQNPNPTQLIILIYTKNYGLYFIRKNNEYN